MHTFSPEEYKQFYAELSIINPKLALPELVIVNDPLENGVDYNGERIFMSRYQASPSTGILLLAILVFKVNLKLNASAFDFLLSNAHKFSRANREVILAIPSELNNIVSSK